LAQHPGAWLNRPLRVRAMIDASCPWAGSASPYLEWQPMLTDPTDEAVSLPLVPGGASPFMALLQRLPFLRTLVPSRQQLHWGAPAVYRVHLQIAHPCQSTCYEAVLVDAAPAANGQG
jgi:hypothetical protein